MFVERSQLNVQKLGSLIMKSNRSYAMFEKEAKLQDHAIRREAFLDLIENFAE